MNKTLTTMVGAALLMGAAVPALAQDSKPTGLSLRAGIFLPTDRGVRDVADSWFAAGLDYRLPYRLGGMGDNSNLSLSLDFAGKNDFRVVPVLVNYVVHRDALYVFGGVGVAFSRRPVVGGTEDRTRFAYQVGLGYDFKSGANPIFVEGKFIGNDNSDLNGFGAFVGIRF